jgi:hypothetical protein
MSSIEQFAAEMKVKREIKKKRLDSFVNSLQAGKEDVKSMRETLVNVHNALPVIEGPVKNTFEVEPRIFFASQKEFNQYVMDRPSYWSDDRVKKVYSLLMKVDYKEKNKNTLIRLKNIFTLIK